MFDINLQIPMLLILLFAALGTSVFIGLGHWCLNIYRGRYDGEASLHYSAHWCLRGAILVLLFPLFVKAQFLGHAQSDFSIQIELVALALVVVGYLLYLKKQQKPIFKNITSEIIKHIQLLATIIFIWALSVFVGLMTLFLSAKGQTIIPIFDPARDTAMVVSGLWIAPFIISYMKIQQKAQNGSIKTPEHFKFYKLLGPILLGLFLFMVPLMVEKFLTSDKYKEMLDRKPPLERV